jgi:putative addiction module component (TIGR02574 family)
MSAAQVMEQVNRLPFEEQREVFEQLRGKFDVEPTSEQLAEFERRGEELRRNPKNGIPWEQVRAELKERIKGRAWLAK